VQTQMRCNFLLSITILFHCLDYCLPPFPKVHPHFNA